MAKKMKNTRSHTLLLLLCLVSMALRANPYVFRELSVSGGLSDLLVNALYKDSVGYVYIGTAHSLDVFDGVRLHCYPLKGADENRKRVNAIAETPGREIWVANAEGLWHLDKTSSTLERVLPETIDFPVLSLCSEGGTLYIGSERGLFIYREGQIEYLTADKDVFSPTNAITAICPGEGETLWLAARDGLHAFDRRDRSFRSYHHRVEKEGNHLCGFRAMTRMGHTLYVGTMEHGLLEFDTESHRFSDSFDVDCNVISALDNDGGSTLYVGTDGAGVTLIDVGRRQVVTRLRHQAGVEGGLRSNSVYSLLVDRDGLLWVGYYQSGLDYTLYQQPLFHIFSYSPTDLQTQGRVVRSICIRGDEMLIGMRDGLSYIDRARRRSCTFDRAALRMGMVFDILPYRGEYLVGTYGGGLHIFNPRDLTLRDFDSSEALPFVKGQIFCLTPDPEGQLWIGTSSGLYCYRDGTRVAHYTCANSRLPDDMVYDVYFDSTGKGWICTERGLCLWDASTHRLRTDLFPEGFVNHEKIRVVYEDSRHTLYLYPEKGTLCISDLSMSTLQRLLPGTPLDGQDGVFLQEDAEGNLWIGTTGGLFCRDTQGNVRPFGFLDGIPSPVFNFCRPYLGADGRLWLGNEKGLLYADLADLRRQSDRMGRVCVTHVAVNGRPSLPVATQLQAGAQHVTLQASQRNLSFGFSDFSYTDPRALDFECCLSGVDDDYVRLAGRDEAAYYELSPGHYTLRVRATGRPSTETVLQLHIASSSRLWLWALLPLLLCLYPAYRRLRRRPVVVAAEVVVPAPQPPVAAPVEVQPQPVVPQPAADEAEKSAGEKKYKNAKVSADECRRMAERLEELMQQQKPYTNSDLKIADLATMLGVSAHALSYLFNQYLNRNYYDYINDYRIAEFKRVAECEKYARFTLTALAELCGFSSRASFFRYFKKSTGITPSEYVQRLGRKEQ